MAAKRKTTRANKRKDITIEEREKVKKAYVKIIKVLRKRIGKAKERAWVKLQDEIDKNIWGK